MQLLEGDTLLAQADEITWLESEQGYKAGEMIFVDTQKTFTVIDTGKKKKDVQQALDDFAREKDLDGIGEASALLNSTNPQWQIEAQRFVELWDATWQAFYASEPLPILSWD